MNEWLLLSYKVPPEPSSKRVSIWRKIKGCGAIYIQNGVCMLPKNDEHQRQFKIIQNEIVNIGGETLLLETVGLDKKEEENIISRFNEERNDQYQEFLDKCTDYKSEIKKETENKHFTYAELQENDEDLKKQKGWLEKIRKLDFFGAPLLAEAEKQLLVCEQMLEEFAQRVFNAEEL
ncbi:chromate resistance protein ChrB [Desulfosporosinus sp. PR]|uniref:Chromate resistance protein ChrB n=1 Tax=Candidatus Desulfosporosinus nitrosoreducens TaxID=3401928 RepID=UPI0027F6804A|nr:Chromate resistance protein ChrB [Desulfosporosinus sp. PR]MDQ7096361.1 chromate resistance protein ChrB [Desulfosporosinus sp. PR]